MEKSIEEMEAEIQARLGPVQEAGSRFIAAWEEMSEESAARRELRYWLHAWLEIDGDGGEEGEEGV